MILSPWLGDRLVRSYEVMRLTFRAVLVVPSEVLLWQPSSGHREKPLDLNLLLWSVEMGLRSIARALGNPCSFPAACLLFLFVLAVRKGAHPLLLNALELKLIKLFRRWVETEEWVTEQYFKE